eukprot:4092298-Pyramimonas_sp.AAC.1
MRANRNERMRKTEDGFTTIQTRGRLRFLTPRGLRCPSWSFRYPPLRSRGASRIQGPWTLYMQTVTPTRTPAQNCRVI